MFIIYLYIYEHTCIYNPRLVFSLQILKVIGRKWRVKTDFKAESSVITSVIHMMTDDNIQTRADCSPSSWQKFDTNSKQSIICQMKEKESFYDKEFNKNRY